MNNNKTILAILVGILVIFGGAAIYLGIQLNQRPTELPITGTVDPNTICDSAGQNNGFLFVCNANADGQLFSCQDRLYHGANFAHACAPILTPSTSCSGLTNLGTGPWENDPYKLNFVGCYFKVDNPPQNCFCPSYPNGTIQCSTDSYGWGTTYDSCGARYIPPTTPTPINSPSNSITEKPSPSPSKPVITTPPLTTKPPTPSPSKPAVTTPVVTTRTGTPTPTNVIPKSAIVSDEVDRVILGGVLFLFGLGLLATGKFVSLGFILNNLLAVIFPVFFKKQKTVKERLDFEEKFV
jgi:hypothetical protein